ncbi:MAG: endolytic transglycosylase MltG [bacterium]|nr:endolytic transglycosylase MltG [bacterium]
MRRVVLAVLALFLFSLVAGSFIPRLPGSDRQQVFVVAKGEGSREIAYELEKEGIISLAAFFRLYVASTGIAAKLQAGEYLLSPSMSVVQIAGEMRQGRVIQEELTIIEGWNLRDIGYYLENRGLFQAEELHEVAGFPAVDYAKATDLPRPKDFSSQFPFLQDKPGAVGLEGYLFPDTYYLRSGDGVEGLVVSQLKNFQDKTSGLDLKGKNLFEVVTIASMLEKEVRTYEDKRMVAGILYKRLEHGIPLQVDATVAYAVGKRGEAITKQDLQADSPFNTYKYPGLPLGPIANPGIESIRAALNPQDSPYLYYLSTPDGETIFSETLEEHNRAVGQHLR